MLLRCNFNFALPVSFYRSFSIAGKSLGAAWLSWQQRGEPVSERVRERPGIASCPYERRWTERAEEVKVRNLPWLSHHQPNQKGSDFA
ncbi:hypothetical protein RUM43_007703 [Polyplax serrata]|uniref:Uncharacterized protein n=1 Tax=Polyplax serrata TaxID=468196 RepID=A0AAN8P632_POLSC